MVKISADQIQALLNRAYQIEIALTESEIGDAFEEVAILIDMLEALKISEREFDGDT